MQKKIIGLKMVSTIFMIFACLLLAAGPARAHRVNVFAYVEGDRLAGEGYFPGGKEAQGCKILVLDGSGAQVGEAVTGEDGAFSLALPKGAPPFTVVLEAGSGHKTKYVLSAKEMGLVPAAAGKKAIEAPSGGDKTAVQATEQVASPANSVTMDEVRKAVGEEMDRRLRPLQAQVARLASERNVGVADVIGGLGYILGLVGLAAWFKSRKNG